MKPPKRVTVGDTQLIIAELLPLKAIELLPEIIAILTPGFAALTRLPSGSLNGLDFDKITLVQAISLAPVLGEVAKALGGGKLLRLAPDLLATTTVIIPKSNEKFELTHLSGTADMNEINRAFAGRAPILLAALASSVEVTFRDFLSVSASLVAAIQERSQSKDSDPGTRPTANS